MRKPSFFEKLTGAISPDDYDDLFEHDDTTPGQRPHALQHEIHDEPLSEVGGHHTTTSATSTTLGVHDTQGQQHAGHWAEEKEEEQEGELAVDIYQTTDSIVVKALVAGVNPSSIDISLTRDMITIRGHREEHKEVQAENYFYKELYWGAFSRTILLPEEVDVDMAEASTNHGILAIRLPKINKERKTKLKVKAR